MNSIAVINQLNACLFDKKRRRALIILLLRRVILNSVLFLTLATTLMVMVLLALLVSSIIQIRLILVTGIDRRFFCVFARIGHLALKCADRCA